MPSIFKIFTFINLGFSCILLLACSSPTSNPSTDQSSALCKNLQQEILMNDRNSSLNNMGYSPTKAARLYKEYTKYQCAEKASSSKIGN